MLNECALMGFIPTKDPARSRAFYVDLLGLTFISQDPFATEIEANGTRVRIVKAPDFTPLPMTLLGWRVPDIAAAAKELIAKGLVFERYRWFEQDALGIWTAPGGAQVAWFLDPDGNTLSLSQHVS